MKTIDQIRAARSLLGWSQSELAARAGLSLPTVKRLEGGPKVSDDAQVKLQKAIEAAGIEFLDKKGRRSFDFESHANRSSLSNAAHKL